MDEVRLRCRREHHKGQSSHPVLFCVPIFSIDVLIIVSSAEIPHAFHLGLPKLDVALKSLGFLDFSRVSDIS
jgi:hypothetical protein